MKAVRPSERIENIDVAKALGLFLVIIGHSVTKGFLRGPIFAFHMPLFFIASGMTYRFSRNSQEFFQKIKRAAKKFLLPAAGLFSAQWLVQHIAKGEPFAPQDFLISLFYGSGVAVHLPGRTVPAVGAVWFLFVLFCVRGICDLLHLCTGNNSMYKLTGGGGILLSVLGVWLGQKRWLPLSFDIALAATSFFLFGTYLRQYDFVGRITNVKPHIVIEMFLAGGILLAITYAVKRNYLELASREYPMFPLCYIIAALWTLALLNACQRMLRWRRLTEQLLFIGRNTITLFGIHYMDAIWKGLWQVAVFGNVADELLSAFLRTVIDVALLYLLCFGKKLIIQKVTPSKIISK